MKQFTEAEFKAITDDNRVSGYDKGFAEGFEAGMQTMNYALRGKVINQRRELRRLNSQLNYFLAGFKQAELNIQNQTVPGTWRRVHEVK